MIGPQTPQEPNPSGDFDVSNIESPAQRMIREGYDELTVLNQLVINNFDPYSGMGIAVELETDQLEAEDQEPQLASAKRAEMLRNLGLAFTLLEDDDPNNLLQHKFEDGAISQLRLIDRGDGQLIPVFTRLMGDRDSNVLDSISLLSNDSAMKHIEYLEGLIDEDRILESPTQQILREEFEAIEIWNQVVCLDFDPTVSGSVVDIRLTTAFPEAEAAEPKVAEAKRENMLNSLGLGFHFLNDKDPSNLFQVEYNNGEIDQIRLITRIDGVKIPVYTTISGDDEGSVIEKVYLLSNDVAEEHRKKLEDNINEQKVDLRLQEEFGLDKDFIKQAKLSFDDKRSMLASYDAIKELEVAKPDNQELDMLRSRFVKGMLPTSNFLEQMRYKRLAKTQVEYEKGVVDLIKRYELRGSSARELISSERLKRLAGLNEQLNKRVIAHKVGLAAMTGTAVSLGALGGSLIGEIQSLKGNSIVHAIIGGGAGLVFGIQEGIHLRKNARDVRAGFLPISTSDGGDKFTEQLAQEKRLAWRYSFKLGRK
jgi:hypothetical protein